MNKYSLFLGLVMTLALFNGCSTSAFKADATDDNEFKERWACSDENFQIAINGHNTPQQIVTSGHKDFKPSWSKTGDRLAFFRRISKNGGFITWRTIICVVNIDGSGFKELSSGDYPDFNPTWTRDGSNMIIFNRLTTVPAWKNQIFMIAPNGNVGDEQLISHPSNEYYEWANSTLEDGRIFIDRINSTYAKSFLLAPDPGKLGKYEEIKRPDEKLWHKVSISPDENKVAYMLDNDRKLSTYNDVVIAIADFDKVEPTVKNPIIITEMNLDNVCEYPRWSKDGKYVVYDSNKSGKFQIYAYNLKDKSTKRISPDIDKNYRFAHCQNTPK